MHPRSILTAAVALAALPATTVAAPPPVPALEQLAVRQFYDGPCSNDDCGVNRVNCRAVGKWCVRYPSTSAPEGCTCSSL